LEQINMKVSIRKMGNSRSVLIPKPMLAQVGLQDSADVRVNNGVIEIRPLRRNHREAWAKDSQHIAEAEDVVLAWPEFGNAGDAELVW
jgi:antitoxin MazE